MKFLKKFKNIICIFSLVFISFIFVSCSSNSHVEVLGKFLEEYKNKNLLGSYKYILENEEGIMLQNYLDNIVNLGDSEIDDGNKLVSLISDRIFDFTYSIGEISEESEDLYVVNVTFEYYDISKAYRNALDEFLSLSLDFENIDNLYDSKFIVDLLVKNIENIEKDISVIDIKIIREGNKFKVSVAEDLANILTSSSMALLRDLKDGFLGR